MLTASLQTKLICLGDALHLPSRHQEGVKGVHLACMSTTKYQIACHQRRQQDRYDHLLAHALACNRLIRSWLSQSLENRMKSRNQSV